MAARDESSARGTDQSPIRGDSKNSPTRFPGNQEERSRRRSNIARLDVARKKRGRVSEILLFQVLLPSFEADELAISARRRSIIAQDERIKASVGSVASYATRYRTRQLRPIFPLVPK